MCATPRCLFLFAAFVRWLPDNPVLANVESTVERLVARMFGSVDNEHMADVGVADTVATMLASAADARS